MILANVAASDGPEADHYKNFYRQRIEAGDLVILDNGADEGECMSMASLLLLAVREFQGVTELVLPDYQQDGDATAMATERSLELLAYDPEAKLAYELAGKPRIMVVPQGKTYEEWKRCLDRQKRACCDAIGAGTILGWTIGLAKNHANHQLVEPGLYGAALRYLKRLMFLTADIRPLVHLLGWPADLKVLSAVRDNYLFIRSVDSARPAAYAKHDIDIGALYPNVEPPPSRGPEFFTEMMSVEQLRIARLNAVTFQALAGDNAAAGAARS